MKHGGRWDRAISHRGEDARNFVADYFADRSRKVLLVAGAGFDPRSPVVAQVLGGVLSSRLSGVLVREERPDPNPQLVRLAEEKLGVLRAAVSSSQVEVVSVFDTDGAHEAVRHVIAGRQAASLAQRLPIQDATDVVLDFSALSIGTSFPLARALLERIERNQSLVNLHAMATSAPRIDNQIKALPSTYVGPVHGFRGRWGIDATAGAAKLWLPQLSLGHRDMLEALYSLIRPDDVAPVLPFPAHDPRLGDELVEHYASELESAWAVDARNLVYAAEGDPLDFYRSVLRLDDARQPVFAKTTGSLLILSPLGSKALALGAMLAAMERNLPVMYVEALGFEAALESIPDASHTDVVHIWLLGDAYSR